MYYPKKYRTRMGTRITKTISQVNRITTIFDNKLTKLTRMFDPNDTIRTKTVNKKKRDVIGNMRASIKGDMKK